jgi:hypothetical protein
MTNTLTELRGSRILGVEVQGIVIARYDGKKFDISCCD